MSKGITRKDPESPNRYVFSGDEWLVTDSFILGGEPIIKGTRMTCRSVKGRVDAGDTIEDLVVECGGTIPREAFDSALTYANYHQVRVSPETGKPWREISVEHTPRAM